MTSFTPTTCGLAFLAIATLPSTALAQGGVDSRLDALEQELRALEEENGELRMQIGAVAEQVERVEFRDIMPVVGESVFGMGPAASKVYSAEQGISLGGYGEGIYTNYSGDKTNRADLLRWVLYAGYKFNDNWVFNSEIEIEHATTSKGGSVSAEFAYLEYMHNASVNVRAGMLLTPMGFVNEMHEPTTFYGASRTETETRILPSTWRENGVGLHGDLGGFNYKLYAMTGFDALGFDEKGLRGGRQKADRSKAQDLAFVGRLDYTATPGLLAGVSAYFGDSGQGDAGAGSVDTQILEAHAEYQWKGLRARALFTQADLGGTEQLFAATGNVVGEQMQGYYVEAGYDIMTLFSSESRHQVIPFMRYEALDTHASVASSLVTDPTQDETIITIGVNWFPIESIVFKADFQDFDQAPDRIQLSMGYVF